MEGSSVRSLCALGVVFTLGAVFGPLVVSSLVGGLLFWLFRHPMIRMNWDVIIVGAGAAGLMAAASAAGSGKRTLLLEKNKKLGVKILMSGGTRCNITHDCDVNGIVDAFCRQGNHGKFLLTALYTLPPDEVIRLINEQGVATKVEHTGKVFPVSNRAIDVRDALVNLAESSGAIIKNECPVAGIEKSVRQGVESFSVSVGSQKYVAPNLVIASGGKSYPGCGTTGDGYAWAKQFGHSIVQPVPSLTPILSRTEWANELKGITIDPAAVSVVEVDEGGNGKPIVSRTNSFLFTHFGFSGPGPLDVSRAITRHPNRKQLTLTCDLLPEFSRKEFSKELEARRLRMGKQAVANLLTDWFPKRLAGELVSQSQIADDRRAAEVSRDEFERLVDSVKQLQFEINGTLGFEKAEVTAGGVELSEIDSRTMQSQMCPGLFFVGEVLDLDGPIGGFNFQSAFSTGWLAGQSIRLP